MKDSSVVISVSKNRPRLIVRIGNEIAKSAHLRPGDKVRSWFNMKGGKLSLWIEKSNNPPKSKKKGLNKVTMSYGQKNIQVNVPSSRFYQLPRFFFVDNNDKNKFERITISQGKVSKRWKIVIDIPGTYDTKTGLPIAEHYVAPKGKKEKRRIKPIEQIFDYPVHVRITECFEIENREDLIELLVKAKKQEKTVEIDASVSWT